MCKYSLPEYPCIRDMWDELASESRPILVYGMGNGADKLFRRLEKYGVRVADVFASDGFVRGHSFRGIRVKSFSEIKEKYDDFVIVLSFGTNRQEVVDVLADIDRRHDMYVPDMPVANEEEYFDSEFYNTHYDEILQAFNSLTDEHSKNTFSLILAYKISGRMQYLEQIDYDADDYGLFPTLDVKVAIDGGAYNGDTLREMLWIFKNLSHVIAVEPDKRSFKKLSACAENVDNIDITLYNAALWSEDCEGTFSSSANRNSTAAATVSYEHRDELASFLKIDTIAKDRVDYIKYDVEGAEAEALKGSLETVRKYRPALRIAVYHRSRDIFSIINYMAKNTSDYDFYIRRKRCLPAWEIDLIMIPRRLDYDKYTTGNTVARRKS